MTNRNPNEEIANQSTKETMIVENTDASKDNHPCTDSNEDCGCKDCGGGTEGKADSGCKGCGGCKEKWVPPETLIHEPLPELSHEFIVAQSAGSNAKSLVAPVDTLPPKTGRPGSWKYLDGARISVDPGTAKAQIESRPLPGNVYTPQPAPAVKGIQAGLAGNTVGGPASIVELSRALKSNVDLIYEWVYNNIETLPMYGLMKGAVGAIVDGAGTPFDQADLMVQLLRQAGYTANYLFGTLTMTDAQVQTWLGADAADLWIGQVLLSRGGLPVSDPYWNGANWVIDFSHCYVQVNISGTNYVFDPSMKTYSTKAAINLTSVLGYNATTFMNDARSGATITADYVQNLNRTNIRSDLSTMSSNLVSWIQTNNSGAGMDDIVGGRQIIQNDASTPTRNTSHPYLTPATTPTVWTSIPLSYVHYLHLVYDTIDTNIYTPDLAGKRLTLFFNASHQAEIRLEGTLIGTSTAQTPGSYNSVLFDVVPPYPVPTPPTPNPWSAPVWERVWADKPYYLGAAFGYIGTGSVGTHSLKLKKLAAASASSSGEDTVGESMAILWNTWCSNSSRMTDIVNRMTNCTTVFHHLCGLVGWFDAPLTDIGAVFVATSALDSSVTSWAYNDTVTSMFGVALEEQVIKECCTTEGISTTPLIDIAVSSGKKIFDGKTANWTTNVVPNLVGYAPGDLANIKSWYVDNGDRVAIPENASITRNSWTGYGYYVLPGSNSGTYGIIQGGLKGGAAARAMPLPGMVYAMTMGSWDLVFWPVGIPNDCFDFPLWNPGHCSYNGGTHLCQCWIPTGSMDLYGGNASLGVGTPIMGGYDYGGAYSPGSYTSAEPIDLASGAYLYDATDISVGSSIGLSFTRSYNSAAQYQFGPLGFGWRHNFQIDIMQDTIGLAGLGGQTVSAAAPFIAAAFVAVDLQSDMSKPFDKYITTALMTQWFADNLSDNVAFMQNGLSSSTFVKMPDGSYLSPAGDNGTLTKPGGNYKYTSLTGTVMNYNNFGHISTIVDPAGVTLTFAYNGDTKVTSVTNGLGRTLTFTYDPTTGYMTSVSDGNGRNVTYGLDANYNLTSVTDPNGKVWTYEYDQPGRMTKMYKPANPGTTVMTNVYDTIGRVKQQKDYQLNTWDYYFAGSRTEEVNPNGKSSVMYFNNLGRSSKTINQVGKKSTTTYDGIGRALTATAPEGNSVQLVYDNKHRVTQTTVKAKPLSGLSDIVSSVTYDPTWGKVKTATDPMGRVTTMNYDPANGNLLSVVSPTVTGVGASTVSMTYNARGQVLTVTAPDGIVTKNTYDVSTEKLLSTVGDFGVGRLNLTANFGYDAVGNLTSVQDPRGFTSTMTPDVLRRITQTVTTAPWSFVTKFTYDDNGNTTKVERQTNDPDNPWQTSQATYSVDNKVLTTTSPQGLVSTIEYDTLQRLWKTTDPLSRVVTRAYDDANRISTITNPASIVEVTYTYTDNGKLSTLKDARNNTTTYTYDGHDRAEKTTYPDATFEQVTSRDGNNNPLTLRTRSAATVTLTYDELNRVKTKAPSGQPTVTTVYDIAGRVTTVSTPVVAGDPSSGTFTNFYDTAGRFYKEQYPDGLSVTHVLDANSNLTKTTYPDGYYIDRVYDELNRLTDIKLNGAGTSAVNFQYDALSRRTKLTYENGCTTSYGFELDNDLNGQQHNFVGSNVGFQYAFDNASQMVTQRTTDPANFRWTPGAPATVSYGTANNINQYPSVGGTGYTYSTDGNLTNDGTFKYEFNTERMMTRVRNAGTNAIISDYLYDPALRQRQKNVGGTKTNFYYAGWQRLSDYDATAGTPGTLLNRYVYGTGLDEVLIQITSGGTKTYYHGNHQGSVIATTNSSGNVVNRYKYSPYGESPSMSGTTHGYTGQRFDSETGLYYYKMRYYSPKLGRFLQADPIGYGGGLNLYSYIGGSPISSTDPMGTSPYDSTPIVTGTVNVSLAFYQVFADPEHQIWTGQYHVALILRGAITIRSDLFGGYSYDFASRVDGYPQQPDGKHNYAYLYGVIRDLDETPQLEIQLTSEHIQVTENPFLNSTSYFDSFYLKVLDKATQLNSYLYEAGLPYNAFILTKFLGGYDGYNSNTYMTVLTKELGIFDRVDSLINRYALGKVWGWGTTIPNASGAFSANGTSSSSSSGSGNVSGSAGGPSANSSSK